ncbi:hypothetical protein [Stutzerimonas nitrititolerans]|nr:hypothetical protein [Stutzerimonas nitrititolerans]
MNQYVLLLVEEEVRKTLHIGGEVGLPRSKGSYIHERKTGGSPI